MDWLHLFILGRGSLNGYQLLLHVSGRILLGDVDDNAVMMNDGKMFISL